MHVSMFLTPQLCAAPSLIVVARADAKTPLRSAPQRDSGEGRAKALHWRMRSPLVAVDKALFFHVNRSRG